MVTINLTLLVLLVMFLGFLWIMHRHVFRPTLALRDRRDQKMAEDRSRADSASEEAACLEDEHAARLSEMHREANLRIARMHRQTQEEHNANVDAFKKQAEEDLRAVRQAAARDIAAQEDQFGALSQELATAMARQLELE